MISTRLLSGVFLACAAVVLWPSGAAHAGGHGGHGGGHGGHGGGHFQGGGHFGGGYHHGGGLHIGAFGFGLGIGHYGGYYDGYGAPYSYYGYEPRSSYYGPVIDEGMSPQMFDDGAPPIDFLASRLMNDLNLLCLDMHYNYANNPNFNDTYRAAYGMLESAKRLRDMGGNDRTGVQHAAQELDGQFRQFRTHIADWSRAPQRQIGEGGLNTKIDLVEFSLQGLMNGLGGTPDEAAPMQPVQPPQAVEPTQPVELTQPVQPVQPTEPPQPEANVAPDSTAGPTVVPPPEPASP